MKIRTGIALVAMMAATTITTAFAQAGADTYKAKCAMCHGGGRHWRATPAGKAMRCQAVQCAGASQGERSRSDRGDEEWQREDAGISGQADRRADQGCCRLHSHAAEEVVAAKLPVAGIDWVRERMAAILSSCEIESGLGAEAESFPPPHAGLIPTKSVRGCSRLRRCRTRVLST